MLYEISVSNITDDEINELKKRHQRECYGTYDLYDSLYMNRFARSYNKSRIYYLAFVLSKYEDFSFEIKELKC